MATLKTARKPRAVLTVYYLKMAHGLELGQSRTEIAHDVASHCGVDISTSYRCLRQAFPRAVLSASSDLARDINRLLWAKRETFKESHYDRSKRVAASWRTGDPSRHQRAGDLIRKRSIAYWAQIPPVVRSKMVSDRNRSSTARTKISRAVRGAWAKFTPEERSAILIERVRRPEVRRQISSGVSLYWAGFTPAQRSAMTPPHFRTYWAQFTPLETSAILSARLAGARAAKQGLLGSELEPPPKPRWDAERLLYLERLPVIGMLDAEEVSMYFEEVHSLAETEARRITEGYFDEDVAGEVNLAVLEALAKWDGRSELEKLVLDSTRRQLFYVGLDGVKARRLRAVSLDALAGIGYDAYGNLVEEPLFAEIYR